MIVRYLRFLLLFLLVFKLLSPSSVFADENLYFIHQDHLGSTALTTDTQGNVVSQQVYYPYGPDRWTNGKQATERSYTSQISDRPQTELYYYNARYYNSTIAKFTQADIGQGPNRYAYVGNNPIKLVDPNGRSSRCAPGTSFAMHNCDNSDSQSSSGLTLSPPEINNKVEITSSGLAGITTLTANQNTTTGLGFNYDPLGYGSVKISAVDPGNFTYRDILSSLPPEFTHAEYGYINNITIQTNQSLGIKGKWMIGGNANFGNTNSGVINISSLNLSFFWNNPLTLTNVKYGKNAEIASDIFHEYAHIMMNQFGRSGPPTTPGSSQWSPYQDLTTIRDFVAAAGYYRFDNDLGVYVPNNPSDTSATKGYYSPDQYLIEDIAFKAEEYGGNSDKFLKKYGQDLYDYFYQFFHGYTYKNYKMIQ